MMSNPKPMHDASAEPLHALIEELQDWGNRASRVLHFTTLANERVCELLFPGSKLGDGYLISDLDRELLGFLVSEAEIEATGVRDAAYELSDKLELLLSEMCGVATCAS